MDMTAVIIAAIVGYLSGSISFARVITRIVAPGHDINKLILEAPDSDTKIEINVVSASTVRMHLGPRYGCTVSILDMAKAAVPALIFRVWQPDFPYYMIAATFAVVGHNWPIYHRFVGGRGLSPILGGMLLVDWLGVLVTNLVGLAIGAPLKNPLIVFGGGILLMIPWSWLRSADQYQLLYMVLTNILFWGAMIPELREFARLRREGRLEEFRDSEFLRVFGRGGEETIANTMVGRLIQKLRKRFKREDASSTPM